MVGRVVSLRVESLHSIFDSPDRLKLQDAYSEHALFSLSCVFPETGPGARFTSLYNADNRNLKNVKNNERRHKLVVQGRSGVGRFLCSMPQTSHDLMSFEVDVPLAEASLMVVVVNGVYSQVADRNPPIRSFKRTLVIIPEGSGSCITNEQLYLTNATTDQVKKAFKESPAPATEPQPVAVAITSAEAQQKEAMAVKFSEASGMLPHYSLVCLEENGWDFEKAAAMFTQLKAENKIPAEYFPQLQS
ncbi:Nuclear RNA export factor 1 [Chionoecetes opilio]|uniref:Nuclear RNA export factor 1 n=1 Tax=Chionoecetes opilio TaxID=41210 RepID=A0A8J5CPG8_CHIOP|nr:Nuclear RNA export factor 1 [Chionoecetes opilio]